MKYDALRKLKEMTPEERAKKREEYQYFEQFWRPLDKQIAAQYRHKVQVIDSIEAKRDEEVLA